MNPNKMQMIPSANPNALEESLKSAFEEHST